MQVVSPTQAHNILEKDKEALLVDVREAEEIATASVPGAISIPLSQFLSRIHELQKKQNVFFICNSGSRSALAAESAEGKGVTGVYNISGGIIAWKKAGLPIV